MTENQGQKEQKIKKLQKAMKTEKQKESKMKWKPWVQNTTKSQVKSKNIANGLISDGLICWD